MEFHKTVPYLKKAKEELNLVRDDVLDTGIRYADFLLAAFPHDFPYERLIVNTPGTKHNVKILASPKDFPYERAIKIIGDMNSLELKSETRNARINTRLYAGDWERLLKTPEDIRRRAADFLQEKMSPGAYGGYFEADKEIIETTYRKIKGSLEGETPEVKIHNLIREKALRDPSYRPNKVKPTPIEELFEQSFGFIDESVEYLEKKNIKRIKGFCLNTGELTGNEKPVSVYVHRAEFPMEDADMVYTPTLNVFSDEKGYRVFAEEDNIMVHTTIPIGRLDMLDKLPKKMKDDLQINSTVTPFNKNAISD